MESHNVATGKNPCDVFELMHETFEAKRFQGGLRFKRDALVVNFFQLPRISLESVGGKIGDVVRENIEDGVLASYVESTLMSAFWWLKELRSVIPEQTAMMESLIRNWHQYLDQAVAYKPDDQFRFCGFSTIEDIGINISQEVIEVLKEAIPVWEGKPKDEVLFEALRRADRGENREGIKLDDVVFDGIDLIASIIVLMRRAGLKPVIGDSRLQDFIYSFFESRIPEVPNDKNGTMKKKLEDILEKHYRSRMKPNTTLGGAAGNQTFLLREMGFQVLVHMPYHHKNQADIAAPSCAKRLVFRNNHPEEKPIGEGAAKDPRRLSFVFNLIPVNGIWPTLKIGGQTITVTRKQPDRVIFRKPRPITDPPQKWETLRVIWKGEGEASWSNSDPKSDSPRWDNNYWYVELDRDEKNSEGEPIFKEWKKEEWPLFYIFQHPAKLDQSQKSKCLSIELASPEELAPIAKKIRSAMLGGIDQMGLDIFTPALMKLLRKALTEQLKVLSKAKVNMRFEIPRVLPGKVLDVMRSIFQEGGLKSISVNREELSQITSEYGSRYYIWVPPAPTERQLAVYKRAVHLATELGVTTVFVHDPGLDILVRCNAKDKPRTGQPDPDEDALIQHRRAMLLAKAAVPEAFYRRAGEPSNWPLVLSKQSLYELLLFAKDYAKMLADKLDLPQNMPNKEAEEKRNEKRDEVEKSIIEKGYWRTEDKNSFSVVVSPTILLDLPPTIGMAGAGDQNAAAQKATAPI